MVLSGFSPNFLSFFQIYKCPASGLLKLKLADFGLACKLKDGELLYHLCGTPTYVAPEVLAEYGFVLDFSLLLRVPFVYHLI